MDAYNRLVERFRNAEGIKLYFLNSSLLPEDEEMIWSIYNLINAVKNFYAG